MESMVHVQSLSFKESIAVISLPEQEMPIVSLDYTGINDHEFSSDWILVDPVGHFHQIVYRKSAGGPVLFKGFVDIRQFYNLKGSYWCILKCKAMSQFDIFIFNNNFKEIPYQPTAPNEDIVNQIDPPVYPLPQNPAWICYPCFFTCKLSPNQAQASELNLPKHVYEYLLQGGVFNWLLTGPFGTQIEYQILGVPFRRYAKFGKGWRSFCLAHELKAGDVVSFFFTSEQFAVVDVHIQQFY